MSSSLVETIRFDWPEYIVFGCVLAISAVIGVYYGCFGRRQNTTSEFLMAGRTMSPYPMSMSLIASFMSAIVLLGTPAEVYLKGGSYWIIVIAYFLVILCTSYLYLPVFFNLQVTSVYEYLEKRFHISVRRLASFIVAFQMSVYMSIVVYAPSLAMTQVTGMNVYAIVALTFAVCIFYTTLGGMKAVIWTDAFQVVIMFGSVLCVMIKGATDVGGFSRVWDIASNHSRLELFDWNPDPRVRHSVWSLVVGGFAYWLTIYGCNQAQVQRYLTVRKMQEARTALWINFVGITALLTVCCFTGLVMFANLQSCDPLTSKKVSSSDEIMPLFMMRVFEDIPGLPGFFVGGVFAGSLSTVSSGLNSLAAICLEDFVKGVYPNLSEERATNVSKCLAVIFGVISFSLVFLVSQLEGVLQITLSLFGTIGGPLLGVFSLGIFYPWANYKGAFVGTLGSLVFMLWLGMGTSIEIMNGDLVHKNLDLSTEGCTHNFTMGPPKVGKSGGIMEFYRISYMWYSAIGSVLAIIIGLIVSFLTGPQDPRELNPNLISPAMDKLVRWLFPNFRHSIGWDLGANMHHKHSLNSNGLVKDNKEIRS